MRPYRYRTSSWWVSSVETNKISLHRLSFCNLPSHFAAWISHAAKSHAEQWMKKLRSYMSWSVMFQRVLAAWACVCNFHSFLKCGSFKRKGTLPVFKFQLLPFRYLIFRRHQSPWENWYMSHSFILNAQLWWGAFQDRKFIWWWEMVPFDDGALVVHDYNYKLLWVIY